MPDTRHCPLPLLLALLAGLAVTAGPRAQRARETPLALKLRQLTGKAPLTVGHRGSRHDYPENTLPSFRAAVQSGADMVELDFHQTADGALVVVHDATFDRTSDAVDVLGKKEARCETLSLAEIERLDAGRWKDPRFAGTRVPTLAQALKVIQNGSITMIEHKAGSARDLVALLRERHLLDDVLVQSFDWDWLAEVHTLEPRLTIGALGSKPLTEAHLHDLGRTGASLVHWNARDLRVEDVWALHDRGYLICVYTVNDDIALLGAAAMGIDAITTDRPDHLVALLAGGHVLRPQRGR